MSNFFQRHFIDAHACSDCGRHFPASVLISVDSNFVELAGKYCTVCMHKIYDLIGYCDECGNEYPKKYLYQSMMDKSIVCKECLQDEQNS